VLKSTSFWVSFAGENVAAKMDLRERGCLWARLQYRRVSLELETNRRFAMLLIGKTKIGGKRRHLRLEFVQNARFEARRRLLHQFVGVADGNRQVGAAEIIQDGEIYANHFAIAIEERSARPARGRRRIVNNLVL
jgi:hypothetical protein